MTNPKTTAALEWHEQDDLFYTLKHHSWDNGVEQFQNATMITVQGDDKESAKDLIRAALTNAEPQQVDAESVIAECINYVSACLEGFENAHPDRASIHGAIEYLLKQGYLRKPTQQPKETGE